MTTKCYCEDCVPADEVRRTYSRKFMKACAERAETNARLKAARIESERHASRIPAAEHPDQTGWWNEEGAQTA